MRFSVVFWCDYNFVEDKSEEMVEGKEFTPLGLELFIHLAMQEISTEIDQAIFMNYRFVWSLMILALTKQHISSFLERK